MSSNTEAAKEKAAEIGADIIGRFVELGGRGLEGLFSSPWTGVPLAIMILGQIDPSGQMTAAFLTHLSTFLKGLSEALGDALLKGLGALGKGIATGISNLPPETATGQFCVKSISIAGIESHKCWLTQADRDTALAVLRSQDVFHLFATIEAYDVTGGLPGTPGSQRFCVRYTGLYNLPGDTCFDTEAQRADFIRIGVSSKRISNPVTYQK